MTKHGSKPKRALRWWERALLVPVLLVCVPVIVLVALGLAIYLSYAIWLRVMIWVCWCRRGRDILVVYSDSPIWREFMEERVLQRTADRAVALNWSERKRWERSLATMAFRHFGGQREFNPLAVVFRPFQRTRTFRFWQPFRDFKHGKTEPLERMEREFCRVIGIETSGGKELAKEAG